VAASTGKNLLRVAGIVAWIFSGVPAAVRTFVEGPDCLGSNEFVLWAGAFVVFGASFWRASDERVSAAPRQLFPLLAVQTAAALGMVAIVCSGFETALLVVVSVELGLLAPVTIGAPWIVAQSLLLYWLVSRHGHYAAEWSIGAFGFEAFGYIVARIGGREAAARRDLAHANVELRATRELLAMSSRNAERVRIARELHDLVGHDLVVLNLHLEAAKHMANGKAAEPIAHAHATAKRLLGDVRDAVSTLRDERAIDLNAALRLLAGDAGPPRVHLDVKGSIDVCDADRAHAVLRCVQEILTNARKHAGAENLWIEVESGDRGLELRARDDGRGAFDVRAGNGLSGMRERVSQLGGRLSVESQTDRGFAVRAWMPPSGDGA
jgi:signal transduction histidine kinase